MEYVMPILMFFAWVVAFIFIAVIAMLALLMPIFVYQIKKKMEILEESVEGIKRDLGVLQSIATHISRTVSEKEEG